MGDRDNYDAFEDVRNTTVGIFGQEQAALDAGLKKHDSVHAQVRADGVALQFSCQGCGSTRLLTVEYPEIVALKYGVNPMVAFAQAQGVVRSPTRWEFLPHEQAWRPHLKCTNCNFWFPLRVSPDEPERFLSAARRQGFIKPEGEMAVSQICVKAQQQHGDVARR